ncbi:MAG TPA: squalene synthase HpnC, partial [Vicinamibacterales bacterium]|nr:squalene synthase HpnC [Vicinamibacterales bacterium]
LEAAYAYCERLAQSHYENFPVASRLLPARMRPHIAALYAFARLADDMADEGHRPAADRLADLEAWDARLSSIAAGAAPSAGPHAEVFVALRATIDACRLPPSLLHDLISAFRQDVTVTRYATWDDLLDYCRRSANPVGRLVLRVAGYDRPDLDAASDAVCTALQLTNFWQDLEIDWKKGRIYLPAATREDARAREEDLAARRMTAEWRRALGEAVARTRRLFRAGVPVADGVRGRLRWELRATWLGGTRILDKLEAADYDVFTRRPALTRADVPPILWHTLFWTATDKHG